MSLRLSEKVIATLAYTRLTMPKAKGQKWYAVRSGHKVGVTDNWAECERNVKVVPSLASAIHRLYLAEQGYKGASFKSFSTLREAEAFIGGGPVASTSAIEPTGTSASKVKRWYAVRRGNQPGVFTSWEECQQRIQGYSGAIYKSFRNRKDAEVFVNEASGSTPTEASSQNSEPIPSTSKPSRCVYTDGSCRGNGQHGAEAGVGVYWACGTPDVAERLPGEIQTNQKAELYAILRALETDKQSTEPLTIFTDSKFSIGCLTTWFPKWQQNSWRTSTGKPVAHAPLIAYTLHLLAQRPPKARVTIRHVKGHAGDYGNELADALAVRGSKLAWKLDRDFTVPDTEEVTPVTVKVEDDQGCEVGEGEDLDESWLLSSAELEELEATQKF